MSGSTPVPRFENDLAQFLGDLRAWVFSSQSSAARHFELSHTTISRYESGQITAPPSYLVRLAYLWKERLADSASETNCVDLLREVNKTIQWCYPGHNLFGDWTELAGYVEGEAAAGAMVKAEAGRRDYWGEAPDVTRFLGREPERRKLERWMLVDRCRLVAVLGLGGIGKTFLVTRVARQVADHFDFVLWHSLRDAPPFVETMQFCLQLLSDQAVNGAGRRAEDYVAALLAYLRRQRCLLIFDNAESIWPGGEEGADGHQNHSQERYGDLFRTLSETEHKSCLVLTSRERPGRLGMLPNAQSQVRFLTLKGVGIEEGRQLLRHRQLSGDEQAWQRLISRYSGNPLILEMVADVISDVFAGDIESFLVAEYDVSASIHPLLSQQFERLTTVEKLIMYWLAIESEPVLLESLQRSMSQSESLGALAAGLKSLRRRSLVERGENGFRLQNVISEYVKHRLNREICQEVVSGRLDWMRRVPLLKAEASDHIRESQERTVLQRIATALKHTLGPAGLQATLRQIVAKLRRQERRSGYAGGNLLNLLLHLGYDIENYDFSGLSIWQAYLRDARLAGVRFTNCHFANTIFSNTFTGIDAMALSPDGRFLAVATGRRIQLWRLEGLEIHTVLEGHGDLVWGVAFAPDGRALFSSSADHTVRQWGVDQAEVRHVLRGHNDWLWSVAISPDGQLVAGGGGDGVIYTWDAHSGEALNELRGHSGRVRTLAFSRDDGVLASGSEDQTIRLWAAENGRPVRTLVGHENEVTAVAFEPDSERLLSGSGDKTLRMWDRRTGAERYRLQAHRSAIATIAIHPQGGMAASGSYNGIIRLWDLDQRRAMRALQAHNQAVRAVTFDPAGNQLISGSYDRSVRFWDAETGQLQHTIKGHAFQIRAIAYSPDGSSLATCGSDYAARVWDVANGQVRRVLRGHTRWVAAAAYHPTSPVLATGSYDRTVRLWHARTGSLQRILEGDNWIWEVAFSPDGALLAAAGADPDILLWDVTRERRPVRLQGHEESVSTLAFRADGVTLASSSEDRTIRLWLTETGETVRVLRGHDAAVSFVRFTPGEGRLISVDKNSVVCLWDISAVRPEQRWLLPVGTVLALGLSPDGRWLAAADEDGRVYLLALTQEPGHEPGQKPKSKPLEAGQSAISSLAFSPTGDALAGGSLDGTIHLWNLHSGRCETILRVDRPYEGMDITGAMGLTDGQKGILKALGAIERY